jgi:hypothetical protein
MTTFSRAAIAALTMVGVASAQPAPAPAPVAPAPAAPAKSPWNIPAPAPAPAAKTPAPVPAPAAKTPAPAPAAKTPAPVPAPAPAAKMPAPVPAPAVAKVEPRVPPPELAEMAKTSAGTWRCKGEELDHTGAKAAMTATSTVRLDLDKSWLVETMDIKGRLPFKMVAYTTYDPPTRKWRRHGVMTHGGQLVGTSDGMKDSKLTWKIDLITPMGAGMMREHTDLTDPKAGMKGWGEMSLDRGKTWLKVYEMTCRK